MANAFCVPSGNFGNICAGHIARMMGLPVAQLILATNENDVLTEVIAGEMHLKRGIAGKLEVFSDEHQRIGGTDRYPSPMTYLAMAVGF